MRYRLAPIARNYYRRQRWIPSKAVGGITNRPFVNVSGSMAAKPKLVNIGGVFVEKQELVKIGGVFVNV